MVVAEVAEDVGVGDIVLVGAAAEREEFVADDGRMTIARVLTEVTVTVWASDEVEDGEVCEAEEDVD